MRKYKLQHVYDVKEEGYINCVRLEDIANILSREKFVKMMRHALVESLYLEDDLLADQKREIKKDFSIEELSKFYFKLKKEGHLIGNSVSVFRLPIYSLVKDESHTFWCHVKFSVEVRNNKLTPILKYECRSDEENIDVKFDTLSELYHHLHHMIAERDAAEIERLNQLKADLEALGIKKQRSNKRSKMLSMNELEKACAAN